MLKPIHNAADREDWDEHDWERFFQHADVRAAKYQELYETLEDHPGRDEIIAHEMGWEEALAECGGADRNCSSCERRFECEAYEMLLLTREPESMENDPDVDELLACFEQVRRMPAYNSAQGFAERVEEAFRKHVCRFIEDEDVKGALLAAQMVSARIAGGHGIGYERDSLCGNIANCKRALRSLSACLERIQELGTRGILPTGVAAALQRAAASVSAEIERWIESLRAMIWWR